MRITVPTKTLESTIKIAQLAIEDGTLPIMQLLILDASSLGVAVIGVSTTYYIRIDLAGAMRHTTEYGRFTLNPALVLNALKSVSGPQVELQTDNTKVFIGTKVGRVLVNGGEDILEHPEDLKQHETYPAVSDDYLDVATADFASSLAFCAPNTADDGYGRPSLEGLQVLAVDGSLRVAATDGHAAAVAKIPYVGTTAREMLLPNQGVELLLAALSGRTTRLNRIATPESIKIRLVVFIAGNEGRGRIYLSMRLPNDQFPDIARVLPAPDDRKTCELLVADFAEGAAAIVSLEAAAAKSKGSGKLKKGGIRVTMPDSSEQPPKMQMTGVFLSEASEYPIAAIDATPLVHTTKQTIATFESDLFKTTLLAGIQTRQMLYQCNGEIEPTIIRPVGLPADVDQIKIAMPIRA